MRRDLIIGLLASILIHGGTLYGDKIIKFKPKAPPKKQEVAAIEIIEMPRIEPDEPDRPQDEPEEAKLDFVPPTQIDTPQVVTDNSFVQQMQPPPPDSMKLNAGALDIPSNRDTSSFRGMEVFDISKLDQIPQARFRTPPTYPFEMRRAGIAGEVIVDFLVDTEGDVQNAYAIKSSQREFEAAAVQAVTKWKFRPGRRAGKDVVTHMQVPIVFTLNE
jgi:periplasmic protein TonB